MSPPGDSHAEHVHGAPHAARKDYVNGFLLAAVLTAIPFWMVMTQPLGDPALTGLVVMGLAAVQVVVHMVCFLHMNRRVEGGWSLLALLFTLLLVGIMLSGSFWVMYNLNTHMMPASSEMMSMAP